MATLITLMPVGPTCLPVVHAAQVAGWKIIKTTGGRLPPNAIDGDVAMYGLPVQGSASTIQSIAQMNRLSLITVHAEWMAELPEAWVCEKTREDIEGQPPVFEYEFRCFVVDGLVVAASPFRHRGESCKGRSGWQAPEPLRDDAVDFCERVLADERVDAPPAFAMDVGLILGETEGKARWFVGGVAAAWQAEIFGCSPSAVLNVLQRACCGPGQVKHGDQAWLAF